MATYVVRPLKFFENSGDNNWNWSGRLDTWIKKESSGFIFKHLQNSSIYS